MNITLLVNYDLASALALNYLLPNLANHRLFVYFTQKHAQTTLEPLSKLAQFEKKSLFDLKSNQQHTSIENLSKHTSSPIKRLNKVNTDDLEQIRLCVPDLIICIRHMTILKKAVIDLPKYGVINLHSGLLPSYQGVMASFWAMLNNEKMIGTTLHFIEDSTIDTGAIISQSRQICDYSKSYLWNVFSIYKTGCRMILKTVEIIDGEGSIQSVEQTADAQYFSFPTETDLTMFAQSGNTLFNQKDIIDFQLTD